MATDYETKLIDAIQRVAEAARELIDDAEPRSGGYPGYIVNEQDVAAVREALAEWSAVGEAMLREHCEDGETAHAAAWLGAVQADIAAAKQGAK
jgi:hypothetical protein